MVAEKKVGGPTGLEQASRSASHWMWISAALDVLPVVAALAGALFLMREGAPADFFVQLVLVGGVVIALLVVAALWKVRAGYRIRKGAEQQDGEVFASAFVPLRRVLILVFIAFTISTLAVILEGC